MTFDPANPYRRKSSLVSAEATLPRRRDQCIVHQFLASQHRGAGAANGQRFGAHPAYMSSHSVDGAVVDPRSLDGGSVGQADQEAWTRKMTKNSSEPPELSELDLAQYDICSRTLTKKQLSDMAWGMRELSRRLNSMRIRCRVKSIFLLTKVYDQDLVPKARELTRWLLDKDRDVQYVIYVQDKLRANKRFDAARLVDDLAASYIGAGARDAVQRRLRCWDEAMCRSRPHMFEFSITLGGDGTVLYASWLFQRIVPPVLSFALGSLGFLTKFDFEDYRPTFHSAFSRGVTVSLRLRFESTVMRSICRKRSDNGRSDDDNDEEAQSRQDLVEELIGEECEDAHTHRPDGSFEILNEVVVDRGPNPTMSYTEVFGDEYFTSVLADDICVSTPTGSTAYILAAGGSLCHPENPVMLVTSACAHTLSFRPIVLPDTIVLRVGVPYDARTASWASFDGRERVELRPGDYVTISASHYPFASVQAEGRRSEDWVNSISGKLGWNTRQKQKSYREWGK